MGLRTFVLAVSSSWDTLLSGDCRLLSHFQGFASIPFALRGFPSPTH